MMKKRVRYMMVAFMVMTMVCGLNGCGSIDDNGDTEQFATGVEDERIVDEVEDEQFAAEVADKQIVEQESSGGMDETVLDENRNNTEKASSGEDLDVVVPNPADDDWYMKGNIYTDDKGNRLEVFFNDYGTLEFAVNGLSMYITTVDNFQQENNWKIYTCDDGTMIGYFPGEPAHLEICDGDYAGLYEAGGDKVN